MGLSATRGYARDSGTLTDTSLRTVELSHSITEEKILMKKASSYANNGKFNTALQILIKNMVDPFDVEAIVRKATSKNYTDPTFWKDAKEYFKEKKEWRYLTNTGGNAAEIGFKDPNFYTDIVLTLAQEKRTIEAIANYISDITRGGLLRLGFTDFSIFESTYKNVLQSGIQRDSDLEALVDIYATMLSAEPGYPIFSHEQMEQVVQELESKVAAGKSSGCHECKDGLLAISARIRAAKQAMKICQDLYKFLSKKDLTSRVVQVAYVFDIGYRAAKAGMLSSTHASIFSFIESKYTPDLEAESKLPENRKRVSLFPKGKMVLKLRETIYSNCSVSDPI